MEKSRALTRAESALDSLRRITRDLQEGEVCGDIICLKGALAWGWHAVGLLAYMRLQPGREKLDAWVQDYLQEGEPTLQLERDARWEERERLSFLELLDLLSDTNLTILKPEFYQGWQDRTSRCQELRRQAGELIGAGIPAEQREKLLLLLAAYHRLTRLPAEVTLDPVPLRTAFPALLDLAKMLIDPLAPEAGELEQALNECRKALER